MGKQVGFDYYYGIEAEQFSFYRVPRMLVKDERFKDLSSDAKLLYGLMLDRMSLSMKHGWLDAENRAYIYYTIENIMEDLGCRKDKGVKVLAELDSKKGIGLIEKKRQGLGKPDIIYVKNFASCMEENKVEFPDTIEDEVEDISEVGKTEVWKSANECSDDTDVKKWWEQTDDFYEENTRNTEENDVEVPIFEESALDEVEDEFLESSECRIQEVDKTEFKKSEKPNSGSRKNRIQEVGKTEFKKSEKPNSGSRKNRIQEVDKTEFKKSEKPNSRSRKIELQEVGFSDTNYTNINYTDMSYTEDSYNNPIYPFDGMEDGCDGLDEYSAYISLIKKNIEYDLFMQNTKWNDRELYEELFQIICDVVCVQRKSVRIGGEDYPYEVVKSKFLKLNHSHLEYVMYCIQHATTKIGNIKAYMITALYNAPNTINHYYRQMVQHDMYGGGWEENGIV
uniref:DUF6017 domain-containing protein n=1 Tax=Agathobacter sp. TaxID=2021311 RepID=UPI0040571F33